MDLKSMNVFAGLQIKAFSVRLLLFHTRLSAPLGIPHIKYRCTYNVDPTCSSLVVLKLQIKVLKQLQIIGEHRDTLPCFIMRALHTARIKSFPIENHLQAVD
jgi:hypothetical protein